jgi:hypothetical protein
MFDYSIDISFIFYTWILDVSNKLDLIFFCLFIQAKMIFIGFWDMWGVVKN